MVFGRKKEVVSEGNNQDDELAVAYGTNDAANMKDDISETDSVPPPPPEEKQIPVEDSPTADGSEENEAVDLDDAKEADPNKSKKMALVAFSVTSFIILLGLVVKYGMMPKKATTLEVNEAIETKEGTTFPVVTEDFTTSNTTTDMLEEIEKEVEQDVNEIVEDILGSNLIQNLAPNGCVNDQIEVFTGCEAGEAFATIDFCVPNNVTDQFWEWIDTPPAYARLAQSDWGWLRDSMQEEKTNLPEGDYTIGIFSDGDQFFQQYPLLTSMEFTLSCMEE